MKRIKRLFSIMLAIIMLFSLHSFVYPVLAEELIEPPMNEELLEKEISEAEILSEVIEKRDEYTKHFYMSDGTFLATEYAMPVHFETESGDWVEYDNTLIQQGDEDSGVYTTTLSNHPISLAMKAESGKTASIDNLDHPISWGYEGTKSSKLRIDDKNINTKGNAKFTTLEKITSTAEYKNIFPHVDLQYIINSEGAKENLILKNKNASNSYVIAYQIGSLSAKKIDDKTIELQDENESAVYVITAPTMYDAKAQYSNALIINVLSIENGTLRVQLTVDSSWLKEKTRTYPVVVDPTIIIAKGSTLTGTYVSSSQPSTPLFNNGNIIVSPTSYGLIKETIAASELMVFHVVSAEISLPIAVNNGAMTLKAYAVSGNWNEEQVTWNTKPTITSTILDYKKITVSSTRANFDITKLYKNISNNLRNGLVESEDVGVLLKTDDSESITLLKSDTNAPIQTVKYISALGVDESYTYSEFDMGSVGTVYINNLTGNLAIQREDTHTTGESYPYDFSSTYNSLGTEESLNAEWVHSCFAGFKQFMTHVAEDGAFERFQTSADPNESDTFNVVGENEYGWERVKITGRTPFTIWGYTLFTIPTSFDAWKNDGTEKYSFDLTGLVQKEVDDEVVLTRQTITINNETAYEYVDADGDKVRIQDNDSETNYTQYKKSGASFILGDTIRYIKNTDGKVTSIQKNGNTLATFVYSGERIMSITNDEGYKLTFTYQGNTKRIAQVEESAGTTNGRTLSFTRNSDSVTVRSTGADCTFGNSDDVLTTYSYDSFARVTGERSETVAGESLGGISYQYTDGNETTTTNADGSSYSSFQSSLSKTSMSGKNAVNLLKNHNLESMSDWTAQTVDDSDCSYMSGTSMTSYAGTTSFQMSINSLSQTGGAGFYQAFNMNSGVLQIGKTYTASVYINTSGLTRSSAADETRNYGASVMIRIAKLDGSSTRTYSESVQKTDSAINSGWERTWVSFTIPSNTTKVTMYLLVRNSTGTALFDCAQLEEGSVPSQYNLLQNSGFVYKASNSPANWTRYNLDSTDIVTSSNQMMIVGNPTVKKGIYQNVELSNASQSDTYILSGWASANSVSRDSGSRFLIYATVYYNSAGITISEQKVLSEFNYYYEGEQYTCSGFDLSNSTDSDAIPTTIRIVACYYYEANTAFFDSICLVKSNDVYDYTTSSGDDLEPDDPYTYYNDGSIATFTDENGTVYYYTYDSLGNLLSRLTASNVGDHYTYYYYDKNNDGINDSAVTATETFEDGSQYIYTYYSDWTLYTETEKNAIGNIVSVFTYNTDGTISSEQTETGTVYNYTYDSMGNLLSKLTSGNVGDTYYYQYFDFNGDGVNESSKVFYEGFENGDWNYYIYNGNGVLTTKYESKNGKTLIYSYDTKGNITSVQHNSFNYNYIYDVFGKPTSVNVGSQPLVTYNYRANNGSLQSVTYGNGSTESYTFNAFGELESKTQSGLGSFSYRYDSQGNPLYETDTVNNQKTFYHLDDNGNKVGEKVYTTTQSNAYANQLYSFVTIPDDEGRTVKNEVTANGKTISTPYTYTDFSNGTSQSTSALTSIRIVTSNYDEDGRITSRSLSTGTPVTESFTYTNNNGVLSHTIGSDQYSYTYDDNGNIIEINKNNVLRQSYEYDADGQLTRENNLDTNKTVVYTYDNGGNITQKQEYAYTTGSLGTATATINYSYDSTWKDKLTNYNGQSISYDAIGNPTTYRGATATWFGRQMQSYTKGSTAVTYKYDSDGLRTQKTVNGKVYDYYYVDGSLVYEKRGSEYEYFYCYDADGRLAMVKRIILASGAVGYFYVVTNAQGDVIELRDGNGNVTAKYTYDSWGKLLSITNANGVTLAEDSFAHQISVRYRGYYYDTETGLYYLQSRYYDPETGRFLNADDVGFIGYDKSSASFNLFCYCKNEPINKVENQGYFVLSSALLVTLGKYLIAFAVLTTACALVTWTYNNNSAFYDAWNKLYDIITAYVYNDVYVKTKFVNVVFQYTKQTIKAGSKQVAHTIAKIRADAKIRSKVKKNAKSQYWTATRYNDYVAIGKEITINEAVARMQCGKSVFAASKSAAKRVAKKAGGNMKPVGPEIDEGKEGVLGYYYHYHTYNRKPKGNHAFFLV